jgi:WD40 repeat protein
VWDAKAGGQLWRWPKEKEWVDAIAFSGDSGLVVAAVHSSVYVVDAGSGKQLTSFKTAEGRLVKSLAISPDGRELAVGTIKGWVGLYSTEHWRLATSWEGTKLIRPLTYTPDGAALLAGADDEVTLLSRPLLKARVCYKVMGGDVRSLTLSPDGKVLTIASGDGTLHGWALADEQLLFAFKGHRKSAWGAVQLPEGQIATVGGDGFLRVWDGASREKIFEQFLGDSLGAVARSPDGSLIATGGPTLRLWKTGTWSEIPFNSQLR